MAEPGVRETEKWTESTGFGTLCEEGYPLLPTPHAQPRSAGSQATTDASVSISSFRPRAREDQVQNRTDTGAEREPDQRIRPF
jgi:hypothetical protein